MSTVVQSGSTAASSRAPKRSTHRLTDMKYRYPGRYLAAWGALGLLIVAALIVAPASLKGDSIWVVTALAGTLALASMGQMLIIMLGAIDLSVPATLAAVAGIIVHYGGDGANVPLVVVAAVAVAVVISTVNGILISVLGLNSLIVTLATFGIVSGLISYSTGVSFSLTGQAPQSIQDFAQLSIFRINACFLVAVVLAAIVAGVLHRTRAGRRVAEVGSNPRAARALGVRVTRVRLSSFAAAGLLYGLSGVLLSGFVGTPDSTVGAPYQLATVTAVGIAGGIFAGGPASVASVVAACIFLQLLDQSLAILGLSAGARTIVQGAALVIAVAAITVGTVGASSVRRFTRLLRRKN
ncbi:ABC transporter permease [Rhodococcus sp. 15-1154-1]|nr:ABC transporter permease [Rhodococcus sp. 15-1154-1]